MSQLSYDLINVFCLPGDEYSGNPLAVFYRAEQHAGLTQRQLQTIATQLNLSETTFASQPSAEQQAQGLSYVNRIFTIDEELPFAGHPTLGTASTLISRGLVCNDGPIVQSCLAGPIKVTASPDASQISLSAPQKFLSSPLNLQPGVLAEALSLEPAQTDGLDAYVSSCGLPFAYVRLRNEQDVIDLRPSMSGVAALIASLGEIDAGAPVCGLSVFFAEQKGEEETRVHARVLLPFQPEDSATGSAGVALGPVLHALGLTSSQPTSRTTYPIAQGAEMGRAAKLTGTLVTDAAGKVAECLIGGEVYKIGEGWVAVPSRV